VAIVQTQPEGTAVTEATGTADVATGHRAMRADARRNRELLITAARAAFGEEGGSASMESIARRAGVGVGTLYRHFPTRHDVVEAVYVRDVDELVRTAHDVVARLGPFEALAAFFDAFARYAKTKMALLTELHQAFEKDPAIKSRARERIFDAFDVVVDNARRHDAIRGDITGADLSQLLSPVCTNTTLDDHQIRRMLDVILEGLRPVSATHAG
jgi:AcrR family transcriptional regulator